MLSARFLDFVFHKLSLIWVQIYIVFSKIYKIFLKIHVFLNFPSIFSFKILKIACMPTYFMFILLYISDL